MSSFWRTWLTIWCWAAGLFGLVLAGAASEATSGATRAVFAGLGGADLDLSAAMRFSTALLGAVSIGWSLTMYAAIRAAHLLGPRAAGVWSLITLSVVAWFIIDSSLSALTGFALNIVPNIGFLAAFLLPVVASGVLRGRSDVAPA